MIFIRYENWKNYLRYYPFTSLLLVANVVMFLIVTFNGGSRDPETMIEFGALVSVDPFRDEWWRYIAAVFLHNGFDHLFFNSFALLVITPPLERILGSFRYAILYLFSGVLGNVLSIAYYERVGELAWLVGASGAIYGVYGAFLYIALFQRSMMDEASRKMLYTLLIMGLLFSFMPNIGWMAHLGGMVGGFFIYGLMIRLFRRRT
ncbi:rhomboid family intramembrane serine protease [Paenibacillus sp. DMB20]|uniref:rhomboid family intramembrane serine protease n=1 Tax=Paenibacillus sp. DMB20 TaxID=1642570 RepID=UPI00062775B0|nr:rhomboid family intramembrane serine protease [Paenibacillus sp. DMB20]KKO52792.1 Rhomboid family protein [Paenibacillus sp. DMB20]